MISEFWTAQRCSEATLPCLPTIPEPARKADSEPFVGRTYKHSMHHETHGESDTPEHMFQNPQTHKHGHEAHDGETRGLTA